MIFQLEDSTILVVQQRVSSRAKHLGIRMTNHGELSLVIPQRMARGNVSNDELYRFLEQHRDWIQKTYRRQLPLIKAHKDSEKQGLPKELVFECLRERWQIEYQETEEECIKAELNFLPEHNDYTGRYKIWGNINSIELCAAALRHLVAVCAQEKLVLYARDIAENIQRYHKSLGFQAKLPKEIKIVDRKTTWGTCSRDGLIKLDCKLLFFPEAQARQVVLHELSHLHEHNHSERFYSLLYSLPGSSKINEKANRKATIFIPAWYLLPKP
ncbi:MAG: M48 family metallopeptidase [Coriobacteriales bacterium]|jgi:predicted metal-dependent hydrolase|nr:M48 family metallopeptidase [Coriobacteriales bacterium]